MSREVISVGDQVEADPTGKNHEHHTPTPTLRQGYQDFIPQFQAALVWGPSFPSTSWRGKSLDTNS
jgi:hypothetical protein